jgi:flavin reductase (DIM6/NTAB) family NADH-FMN oxidoreductase RutF
MTGVAIDQDTFRRTCGRFATGVAVATVAGTDGTPFGLTVNSFTSVSCCPPLVLVCVDYRSSLLPHFRGSAYYGINILSENQRQLSVRFSQRQPDRFDGIEWMQGVCGVPLIRGCLACMECSVSQTIEAGDHAVLIAEVVRAEIRDGKPLLYYKSGYSSLAE